MDGFEDNASGRRALRLGIDASLWYHHAHFSQGGSNPEIRLLFFRLLNMMEHPILPLFVFDGRERPRVKRNSKLGKTGSNKLNPKMKEMLDVFGLEWREVSMLVAMWHITGGERVYRQRVKPKPNWRY